MSRRSLILTLVFLGLATLYSCNIGHLAGLMPQADFIALEGMQEGYDNALKYNDMLLYCSENGDCSPETIAHYDDQFHHFDALFDMHHGSYSHENAEDDHHHESGNGVHGHMVMHNGRGGEHNDMHGESHEYAHTSETLQMMLDLREFHGKICPE